MVHRPRSSISMSTLQPNLPKTRWHRPCYSHPIPAQQSPWDGVPGGWLPSSPLQVGPSRPWQPCWLPSTLPPAPPPPRHQQETTASACRQADNGHPAPSCLHPPPPRGGGTQPSCLDTRCSPGAKKGRTHAAHNGSPTGPVSPRTLAGCAGSAAHPRTHQQPSCAWAHTLLVCPRHTTQPHASCVQATRMWLGNPTADGGGGEGGMNGVS